MSAILDAIRRFFYPIGVAFLGWGEVADAPELPPCGVRFVLTDEQVTHSIAAMEKLLDQMGAAA